jgi:hypothetical protein
VRRRFVGAALAVLVACLGEAAVARLGLDRLTFQHRVDRRSDVLRDRLVGCASGRGGTAE